MRERPLEELAPHRGRVQEKPLRLTLPPRRAGAAPSPVYGEDGFALDPGQSRLLLAMSHEWRISVYQLLIASGHLLFHRYSGQDQFSLRAALESCISESQDDPIIGVIDADLRPTTTIREHIAHVREQFARLDRKEGPTLPEPSHATNGGPSNAPETARICFFAETSREYTHLLQGIHDLHITVSISEGIMTSQWTYASQRFDAETIARMTQQMPILLGHLLQDPGQVAATVPFLTAREQQRILYEWNDTHAPLPEPPTVHQLFEQQAARFPERIAVVYKDQTLSYCELNRRANTLAHRLVELGVRPGELVGVCLARSFDMVTALLAILKAGAAYLPLDAKFPHRRLLHMVNDAGSNIILSHRCFARSLELLPARLLLLDQEPETKEGAEMDREPRSLADVDLDLQISARSLAYVNYTSGSTGTPKGVSICHRNIIRLVFGDNCVRLTAESKILQHATICFDAATFEIWGALLHGATCVLFAERFPTLRKLERCIEQAGVTTMFLTSALFNTIIDEMPAILRSVKQVLVGGEALSVSHIRKGLKELPDTELINGYGPTESTTFASYHLIESVPDDAVTVPIGRPLCNTQSYILDNNQQLVPVGVIGELYIGGEGLALGYLNRPELTKEKFVTGISFLDPAVRLYRSGDLARYLPGGEVDLVGRIDGQIKIHGFRIELGEIETVLQDHPAVRQASVVVRHASQNEKQMVAYLRLERAVENRDLEQHVLEKLPRYMLPTSYHRLEELPVTRNGKLDREQLRFMANAAARRPAARDEYTGIQAGIEQGRSSD